MPIRDTSWDIRKKRLVRYLCDFMASKLTKLFFMTSLSLSGCTGGKLPPIKLAENVDLNRYMGDWYIIAGTPNYIEKNAFNSVENYKLQEDGSIATTFTFNEGEFAGPKKEYHPKGFVVENTGNALWGMQFLWPFKAEYRIAYLDPDYNETIVARNARDYVWIMARTPKISASNYQQLLSRVSQMGYDTTILREVPQGPRSNAEVTK